MRLSIIFAVAIILVLSACGGESSSNNDILIPSIPTPTPTPKPTPTPTYVVPDLRSDFNLTSSLGYIANVDDNFAFVSGAMLPSNSSAFLEYFHNPENVRFGYDGTTISFSASQHTDGSPFDAFRMTSERLIFDPMPNLSLKYTTSVARQTDLAVFLSNGTSVPGHQFRIALFGTRSSLNDPLPQDFGYDGQTQIFGGGTAAAGQYVSDFTTGASVISWSIQPDGRIIGSIPLVSRKNGSQTGIALLRPSGSFDAATNSISGTLSDATSGFSGSFRGVFIGPNRAELAVIFEFSRPQDGLSFFGHYIGKR